MAGDERRARPTGWSLLLVLLTVSTAVASSPARECRRACGLAIDACVDAGGRRAACRRRLLGSCRREGITVCLRSSDSPGVGSTSTGILAPPASLGASASSSTTIDLAWQDTNSRERGYLIERSLDPASGFVAIGSVGRDRQSYQDVGLADGTTYSYQVQAWGQRGLVSLPSNVASATTPLGTDTLPPSPPGSLTASVVDCTEIDLTWPPSIDAGGSGLKGYYLYRDDVFAGYVTAPATSMVDTHVGPATAYTYQVSALDNAGNESTRTTTGATTPDCPSSTTTTTSPSTSSTTSTTTLPAAPFDARGCLAQDSSPSGFERIVETGFTVVQRDAYRTALDVLPAGVKGLVSLGSYDNATCTFERSDDWLRAHVTAIAGHPGIAAYDLADEPQIWKCRGAADQLQARSDLVKSLDATHPTLIVVGPHGSNPYVPYVGKIDVIAARCYPCTSAGGCQMSQIDDTVRLLEEAGAPHYWGMIQAFADTSYRLPTPDELREEFRRWRLSRMEGHLVASWSFGGDTLENHPELIDTLASENGATPPATTSTSTTTTSTSTTATTSPPTTTTTTSTSSSTSTSARSTTTTATTTSTTTTTRASTTSTTSSTTTTRAPTTTTTPTTTRPPATTTTTMLPPGAFFPRGMYENIAGARDSLFQSLGFTAVNADASRSALDADAALGLKGMVWLGDYDDASCAFTQSDASIAAQVDAIQGHAAILGYYIADEPEQALEHCPDVAQQVRARSDLVKLHDPTRPTYIVVSNGAYVTGHVIEDYPYHYFVGAADVLGLDIYPCHQPAGSPCDFADIDRAIAAANSQGVARYYAVLQDFADSTWRRPTPAEVVTQFDHWAASRMEGYFIFSWDWAGNSLDGNTAHQDMLRTENARVFGSGDSISPSVPTGLTATAAASCGQVNLAWNASADTGGSGVAGYRLYRGGAFVKLSTATATSDTGLAGGTSYSYQVSAVDNAGNESARSTAVGVTTPTCPVSGAADEIHWTVTGQTSVTVDWRGATDVIRYGTTSAYGQSATAQAPSIAPFSSAGPFWEARLTGLQENTVYHYAIGSGADHTFKTPPSRGSAGFTVYAEGDIGSSRSFSAVAPIQSLVAAAHPDLVLGLGDLTYGNNNGQADVDQHFNDVMVWSQDAPYEAVWGNHEWDEATDDLRNYKGRFDFANPQTDPASPSVSCCGEDWHWFDYGNTRFIAYPEPWDDWAHWDALMSNGGGTGIMDQAQADPAIRFIVTYGHRPAWSTGYHAGDATLATYMKNLHATHAKYVLNLNGHSHDYERSDPARTDGVTHVTSGTGGGQLENVNASGCLWQSCPPPAWSVKRYMHYGVTRLVFGASSITGQFLCGPPGGGTTDVTCNPGDVIDSFTIP